MILLPNGLERLSLLFPNGLEGLKGPLFPLKGLLGWFEEELFLLLILSKFGKFALPLNPSPYHSEL